MALQSKLFFGDRALEACLISDPAHLVLGVVGPHVQKVQIALIALDDAIIDVAEFDAARYGATTAAAVLAYKTRREIINRAYQTRPDNIVGKMTMARLDRDMIEFEAQNPATVSCDFGRRGNAEALAPAVGASSTSPLAEAVARKADALAWIRAAKDYLQTARNLMPPVPGADLRRLQARDEWAALSTHFKFDRHIDPQRHISYLALVYAKIGIIVSNPERFFAEDPGDTGAFARAPLGGFSQGQRITFCAPYVGKGPLFQTAVIVHEAAHLADDKIDHFASELPKFDGSAVDGLRTRSTVNYAQMSPDQAACNAYSYAQFALHAFKKTDHRLTPFHE